MRVVTPGIRAAAQLGLGLAFLAACHSTDRGAAPIQRPPLGAGFRYSVYGPAFNPGPQYWARVGREMAARFPGATPEAIWIVSRVRGEGTQLNFPAPAGEPGIEGTAEDGNEAALSLFDELGFRVWLQVEPSFVPVEPLIHLVLERYAHHRCVAGFGIDVEWYRSFTPDEGQAVTDAEAIAWLAAVRTTTPPTACSSSTSRRTRCLTVRDGLLFIDDSQIYLTLDALVEEFAEWARTFAPAPVAFQYGYLSDRPWWRALDDPPGEIGKRILEVAPNTAALFWVDFSVLEVFPPDERPASEAP
jgi:hypothetical protein